LLGLFVFGVAFEPGSEPALLPLLLQATNREPSNVNVMIPDINFFTFMK
jgi:hypothetical protein